MTATEESAISWRIPGAGESQLYKIGALQVLAPTLIFGVLVVSVAPNLLLPSLAAVIPVMAYLLWRNWKYKGPGRKLPDNLRIDARGVAWSDEGGHEHLFPREQIEAFRIGHDCETLRPVPSLTLTLAGGYESQPIEVHPPADDEQVRAILSGFKLHELAPEEIAKSAATQVVDGVDFTHEEEGAWELRGARPELLACCDRLAAIAEQLRSFPRGARPLRLQFGPEAWQFSPRDEAAAEAIDTEFHCAPDQLLALAARLSSQLDSATVGEAIEVPLFDHPDSWLVRLRVRNS